MHREVAIPGHGPQIPHLTPLRHAEPALEHSGQRIRTSRVGEEVERRRRRHIMKLQPQELRVQFSQHLRLLVRVPLRLLAQLLAEGDLTAIRRQTSIKHAGLRPVDPRKLHMHLLRESPKVELSAHRRAPRRIALCFPRALGAADKQSHQLAFEGIEVR